METRQSNCGVNDSFDYIGDLNFKRVDAAVRYERRLTVNTARKNCIWYDQCGSDHCRGCEYYDSLGEEAELDEGYCQSILEENAQEYEKVIQEYSDRG